MYFRHGFMTLKVYTLTTMHYSIRNIFFKFDIPIYSYINNETAGTGSHVNDVTIIMIIRM